MKRNGPFPASGQTVAQRPAVGPLALAPDAVHVWWCAHALDEAPRARRARTDRVLRRVLAHYLDQPPETLRFGRESRGRPFLLGDSVPDFNLSDTVGGSVVAVAAQGRVGVDLERVDRQLPHRRLALRYFSSSEHAHLETLPEDLARAAFLRLWTAKEASCKSTGTGIFGYLPRWIFDPAGDTTGLLQLPDEAGDRRHWHHARISPAPGYTAVLACDGYRPQPLAMVLPDDDAAE